jgi:hypothetical protein
MYKEENERKRRRKKILPLDESWFVPENKPNRSIRMSFPVDARIEIEIRMNKHIFDLLLIFVKPYIRMPSSLPYHIAYFMSTIRVVSI